MDVSVGYRTFSATNGLFAATEGDHFVSDEVSYVLGVVSQGLADKVTVLETPRAFEDGEHPGGREDDDLVAGVNGADVPTLIVTRWSPGTSRRREVVILVPRRSGQRFAILLNNPNAPSSEAVLVDAHVSLGLTVWSVNSTRLIRSGTTG
jgi:hypothetical protein